MLKKIPIKEKDFYQISLKVIMVNKKGEILGLNGVKGGSYENYYDLPGGRIDTDEFNKFFGDILKREIKEELGNIKYKLNIRPVSLGRHLIPNSLVVINARKSKVRVLYLCFEAKYLSGKIIISPEHLDFAWLKLNKTNMPKYFRSGNLEALKMYLSK